MAQTHRSPILDRLAALADSTRNRILLVLSRQELTVTELCAVLQLPQSTVSRHLKVLSDGNWVVSRRDGTSHLYRFEPEGLDASARGLWDLARAELARSPGAVEDRRRFAGVLADRRRRSREFFDSAAGQWDRMRAELFGSGFQSFSLLAFLPDSWHVADLGCGTGAAAAAIAPFVRRVTAIDDSAAMLDAARERLVDCENVELRRGELESLPLEDASVDAATLMLVLHHVADPSPVLGEAARILRPGGKLLIVDMLPHERHEYRQDMGHVWMGFSERQLGLLLAEAGLESNGFRPLPAQVTAKGPSLFAASATREDANVGGRDAPSERWTKTKRPIEHEGVKE